VKAKGVEGVGGKADNGTGHQWDERGDQSAYREGEAKEVTEEKGRGRN